MDDERWARRFPIWVIPLAVLALWIVLVATDFSGIAAGLRALQFDLLARIPVGPRPSAGSALAERAAYAELAFLLVSGAALTVLFAYGRPNSAGALTLVTVTVATGFSAFLFATHGLLLDSTNPSVALALAFAGGFVADRIERGRLAGRAREQFAGIAPPQVVAKIARVPNLLRLDGELRIVTGLSCGARNGSELARAFAAGAFVGRVGAAIGPLIDDAAAHGALIEAFDGLSFTASWNAPLDDPEHARHACEAAGRMTAALTRFNAGLGRGRDADPADAVEIGIGIATGQAIAGGFRGAGRARYCIAGECTRLARTIRELSAQYGHTVMASEATRVAAPKGFAFLEADYRTLWAREPPVRLYAMLGNPLVGASPKFRAVATIHEHIFRAVRMRQWEKARALIEQCRKLLGTGQQLYDLHLARIAHFEKHPPAADWDGAFRPILD